MKPRLNKWILLVGVVAVIGFTASDSFAWTPGGHDGYRGGYSHGGSYGSSYGSSYRGGHDSYRSHDYKPYYNPRVYVSQPSYYHRAPVVIYDRPCYVERPYYRPYSRPSSFRFSISF